MSQREEKYCSPSKQKEKLENNNPCWSGRRLNSLVLCSTLRSPEWKTRLKCTLPSQGQKKERSDEIMIRKGKINELLASLRVGCAGFMNVRTYSWPCTGICEKCATAASLCAWPIRSESAEIQRSWNSALLKFALLTHPAGWDWPHHPGGLCVHHSSLKDQQGQRLPWM